MAALIVVMAMLVLQNRNLKSRLAELESGTATGAAPRLEVGDTVEGFTLASLEGLDKSLKFSPGDPETLLFFFSPDCPACETNFANWQTIDRSVDEARRTVFVSTLAEDRTREYLAGKGLRGEVLLGNRDVLDRYKVSLIPTTVQVAAEGVVRGVWVGVLSDSVTEQLIQP